eukprot:5633554-Pleurochrysis_carterae.AAC.1
MFIHQVAIWATTYTLAKCRGGKSLATWHEKSKVFGKAIKDLLTYAAPELAEVARLTGKMSASANWGNS